MDVQTVGLKPVLAAGLDRHRMSVWSARHCLRTCRGRWQDVKAKGSHHLAVARAGLRKPRCPNGREAAAEVYVHDW